MVDNSMLFAGFVFVLWLIWGGLLAFQFFFLQEIHTDGGGQGRQQGRRVRRIGSLPLPCMVLSYSIPAPSRMTRKIFLSHPHSLGPRKSSLHLVKLYFLLICLQLLQLFLIKPNSVIKIYLKLQINLSHQIKLIFSKI